MGEPSAERALVAAPPAAFDIEAQTLIVGAGAAGLMAALSAHERGEDVLVVERDAAPGGSTALSAGLIPAAGTRFQRDHGIDDDATIFAADIQRKADDENDPAFVELLASRAAEAVEWLADAHSLPFSLVDDFDYPGHSRRRMHGLPSRSGRELIDRLREAVEAKDVPIVGEASAATLYMDGPAARGIMVRRPDGSGETIGCERLVLASNGFGGNRARIVDLMPDIAGALWFGHDGNRGEALDWGEAIGARTRHLGAYQGHGNVAHPHGILITWAVMAEGGVQVNRNGERFSNESRGYSEAAREVLRQPDGEAFAIFDGRIAGIARQFADFREAEAQGAIRSAGTPAELARALGLPEATLEDTLAECARGSTDRFGRTRDRPPLAAPFLGVRVTGALFHTQGGLEVDRRARVLRQSGEAFANLHAVGGAAVGVSGASDTGYLSGNGLLSAIVLGRIAGRGEAS